MGPSDNLLNMTQSFVTPDLIQKFSRTLGQPTEKIQSGLKSVLPAFLMGVANKGSSSEGAASLIKMAKSPSVGGSETVDGIFGNNLSTFTTSLGASNGMSSSTITKMMSMIAPMVMGIIGRKVNQDGMNANGLVGFFDQQKSSLANMVPTGISNMFGYGAASTHIGTIASSVKGARNQATPFPTTAETTFTETKKKSMAPILLVTALALGFLWWMTGRSANKLVTPTTTMETPINTVVTTPDTTVSQAANLSQLDAFMKSGNLNEIPKRFMIAEGSAAELDMIAAAMIATPEASARIEVFTDNLSLSGTQAEAMKQELVARKIAPGRLTAAGRGSEGRAQNRRIEFVVTGL